MTNKPTSPNKYFPHRTAPIPTKVRPRVNELETAILKKDSDVIGEPSEMPDIFPELDKPVVDPASAPGNGVRVRGRTPYEIERDRVEIAALYLQGFTHNEIMIYMNERRPYQVSFSSIRKDLEVIRERWVASYLVDFDAAKAKELARIDKLERAYWEGYARSMKPHELTESEIIKDEHSTKNIPANSPTYQRQKTRRKTITRDGAVHFLQGVQWCIEQRCRIFGLLSATKIKVDRDWKEEARESGIDPEEFQDDLVRQFIESAAKAPKLDGKGHPEKLGGVAKDSGGEEL